jgi:hypothetical protein
MTTGMFLIESVSNSQSEILNNIIQLYCPFGIDLDPTYSTGNFYKDVPQPLYKMDIDPQVPGVIQADSQYLPLLDNSIRTIMFDPPFIVGSEAGGKPGIIKTRFSYYKNIPELWEFYRKSIAEFYRVTFQDGILIFKCQDTIDGSKQYLSHVEVINYALRIGYYPIDLFVLLNTNYLVSPNMVNQQHARKRHSYFVVFKKTDCKVKYSGSR